MILNRAMLAVREWRERAKGELQWHDRVKAHAVNKTAGGDDDGDGDSDDDGDGDDGSKLAPLPSSLDKLEEEARRLALLADDCERLAARGLAVDPEGAVQRRRRR